VSDHDKAFAQFPGAGNTFFFIDIFSIEAIGQSQAPEVATVFMTSGAFYSIEVDLPTLEQAECAGAAEYAYGIVAQVAAMSAAAAKQVRADDSERDADFDDMVKQALEDPTAG
jgi:hypothetical protein